MTSSSQVQNASTVGRRPFSKINYASGLSCLFDLTGEGDSTTKLLDINMQG